jgi:EcsC protein family
MPTRTKPAKRRSLTTYESEQVRLIAAWKSRPPNLWAELSQKLTLPGARAIERLLPERIVRAAIEKAYDISVTLAGQEDIKLQAGVRNIAQLRHRTLDECDLLAKQISAASQVWASIEGAATGAGGIITTALDMPLLFILALRTILRIGHCYGYTLEGRYEQRFVLGVLITATSGTLETKRTRLAQLEELEDVLFEESQLEILSEEAFSLLFQLEIFEEIPGIGAVSGALLNLGFIRRVDRTARRIFQERWLRDNGKIREITATAVKPHDIVPGLGGALGRAARGGAYSLGFGAALPVWFMATMLRSAANGTLPVDGRGRFR